MRATVKFFAGMVLVALLFIPIAVVGVVLLRKNPALLAKELAGYDTYIQKVRWRMIPFVW